MLTFRQLGKVLLLRHCVLAHDERGILVHALGRLRLLVEQQHSPSCCEHLIFAPHRLLPSRLHLALSCRHTTTCYSLIISLLRATSTWVKSIYMSRQCMSSQCMSRQCISRQCMSRQCMSCQCMSHQCMSRQCQDVYFITQCIEDTLT